MALGGQKAIPGAQHGPNQPGCSTAAPGKKSSCAWGQRAGSAQGTGPSALPGSISMVRWFWHQPGALTCHSRRAHPANLAAEGVLKARDSRRWPAVMTPRNGGLRADDAVASHSAVDGGGPSIDAARTYAGGISRGAAARCPAFRSAILSKNGRGGLAEPSLAHFEPSLAHFRLCLDFSCGGSYCSDQDCGEIK